jgi:hypothetical protein
VQATNAEVSVHLNAVLIDRLARHDPETDCLGTLGSVLLDGAGVGTDLLTTGTRRRKTKDITHNDNNAFE